MRLLSADEKETLALGVMWRLFALFYLLLFLLLQPELAIAGQLDAFEADATLERRSPPEQRPERDDEDEEDCDERTTLSCLTGRILLDVTGHIFDGLVSSGVAYSNMRMAEQTENGRPNPYLRQPGEPMLPLFRLDLQHQTIDNGLHAEDARLEFGRGAYALQGRYTKFYEDNPSDSMSFYQLHFLTRLSYSEGFGFNLGVGGASLIGNEHNSGLSLTLPVFLHLTRHVGFEFRPTVSWFNGTAVTESDSMLLLSYKFTSVSIGYRSIEAVNEQISGPYLGISFHQ